MLRSLLRLPVAATVLALASFASAAEPGEIDFRNLEPLQGGTYVEVNLEPTLLKLAARFAEREDPAAAEVVRQLKRVRVNVVTLDDRNRGTVTERFTQVRAELAGQGWTPVATVRGEAGEDVAVHVKLQGEDRIEGVVVTVLGGEKSEAVFVNIVGSVDPAKLAELGSRLDLPGLKSARLAAAK